MTFSFDNRVKYFMIVPCIVFLLGFGVFPLIYSGRLMFFDWNIGAGRPQIFVGLGNFFRLFQDRIFLQTLSNTVIFVIVSVTLQSILGLALALLLNRKIRCQGVFRVIFLLPMMASPIAAGYTWRMLFHMSHGPWNHLLNLVGLPASPWLSDISTALISVILIDVWQWTPFMFVILLAGLKSIPREPYEASIVDGASHWQVFKYITIPILSPVITLAILLRAVEAIKVFDIILVTTAGGPGSATETITMYARKVGLLQFNLGYASTISYALLFASIVIFTLLIRLMGSEKKFQ
ncbi:MAG TPA: sugar ABC transporter permease [Atribacteraceae bacterium]|nr:sugar ABC transporter permease [Atribacteraceae bacterium]